MKDRAEIRTPFLHRPLVSFLVTRPWEKLKRADCDRLLQLRALKGWLPEAVSRRPSRPRFPGP
ncbi:MAG: asparagine synthase-related protein [Cyanobacteriota bacterium]